MADISKSANDSSDPYIRYGDVICLHTLSFTKMHGFLQADGIIEDSMRVLVPSVTVNSKEYPTNIRPCLFRVMPMGQYAAQSEYEEKRHELEDIMNADNKNTDV